MNNIIKRTWNKNSIVTIEDLRGMAFQAESGAHTFEISAIDGDGNPVTLSGTASGVMLRPDNTDVALTCAVSGGKVTATLPAECYGVPGRAGITIFLTSDSQKVAIYAAVVSVSRTQSGNASPGTTQSVVDLINAINAAIAAIPASDTNIKAAMAPTYSGTGLYSVGQYAWDGGVLYKCITPITSAENPRVAAHWTAAALGNDVFDLKSALTNEINKIGTPHVSGNLINPTNLINLKSWDASGVIIDDSDTCCYGVKIPVEQTTYVSNKSFFWGLRILNSTGTIIANVNPSTLIDGVLTFDMTNYPTATHVLINYAKAVYTSATKPYFGTLANYNAQGIEPYFDYYTLADNIQEQIDLGYTYEPEPSAIYTDTFVTWAGNLSTNHTFWAGYNVNAYILQCGETIVAKASAMGGDSSNISMSTRFSDGSFKRKIYGAADYTTTPMVYTARERYEYIWIGYNTNNGIDAYVYANPEQIIKYPVVQIVQNWESMLRYRYATAICIGDSLTVGKQPNDTSRDNYPLYLSRMTGMTITNAGESGATTRAWVTHWLNSYNYADYDCAFICLGTNGDIVPNDDNYDAYLQIINKIREDNANCMIFIMEALNTNAPTTLQAIATAYDLPYLNVFTNPYYYLSGNTGSNPTPTHDISGDPTHLSPMGYLLLARNVVTEMCKDMSEHPQRYNQRFENN